MATLRRLCSLGLWLSSGSRLGEGWLLLLLLGSPNLRSICQAVELGLCLSSAAHAGAQVLDWLKLLTALVEQHVRTVGAVKLLQLQGGGKEGSVDNLKKSIARKGVLQMRGPSLTKFALPPCQSACDRAAVEHRKGPPVRAATAQDQQQHKSILKVASPHSVCCQKTRPNSQPDLELVMIEGGLAAKAVLLQVLDVPIVNIDIIKDQPLAWLLGLTGPHLHSSTLAT